MVSITYGHGFCNDCNDTGDLAGEVRQGMDPADTTTVIDNNDYIKMTGTLDGAVEEYFYDVIDFTNISSDVYTKYKVRWKTEVASNGMGARALIRFDDATNQWIVGTSTTPVFSTTWTVNSGTITSGKTIDNVRFYCDDYPDSLAAGSFSVYYDFFMFYKDDFTLPNVQNYSMTPPPKCATLNIPGKVTDLTQGMGSNNAVVSITSDLDVNTWTRTGDTVPGEVFYDIAHNSVTEPFQWLNTGTEQFKVTLSPDSPQFTRSKIGEAIHRTLDVSFNEYSLGDKGEESYSERFGIGL